MISAAEALALIAQHVKSLDEVTVSIEHAIGMALAEDIVAGENIPGFDNSAMDGYAVRSADTANAPSTLKITGEISAGNSAKLPVGAGEAMEIMTGAKIPAGADAVIQYEATTRVDDKTVKLLRAAPPGSNIRRAAADMKAGEKVMECGRELRPQEVGVLASMGKQFVRVVRTPSVAILATGNELVGIDKAPGDGTIRNSNAYAIAGLVWQHGAMPAQLGIARDEKSDLSAKLTEGLRSDMLITIGGVSAGKYDLVIGELKNLGVEIVFWKVNIKPGMPLLFGMFKGKPVFGLPGNPVSSSVTFLQFIRPALRIMKGLPPSSPIRLRAAMQEDFSKNDGKRHYVRGIAESKGGKLSVRTTGSQISNIMTSLAKANCLIVIPEEVTTVKAGEEVELEFL